MKAMVRHEYGSSDVLRLEEIPKPTPGDDEVLIRIHATSLNLSDWESLTGRPFYARIWGLLKPEFPILGSDIAGRVEAVGRNAKRFRPGDEVFGDTMYECFGGLAEYVSAPETALVLKPPSMTFDEVAAVPQAGVIALQGLRHGGPLQPGQKVLINGAGGGAGTFALQIAKSLGAEVTGVDSTIKLDTMRSLGADHVIDYTREDFTQNGQRYDRILDLAAHHSILDTKRALRPKGIYVMVGGSMAQLFQAVFLGSWFSMTGSKKVGLLAMKPSTKDLGLMKELCEAGKVRPVIDRRYPLAEAAEALRYLGEGRARGKVVITL